MRLGGAKGRVVGAGCGAVLVVGSVGVEGR